MKKFFKRYQVLVTALALLIALAGYLNFADKRTWTSKNKTTTEETKAASDEIKEQPGDTVLVSQSVITQAKIDREQLRASNKEALMKIVDNQSLGDQQKADAVGQIADLTALSQKENDCETMLKTKGFDNCVVTITDGKVDAAVYNSELSESQKAQIEDVIKRKTGIGVENIVINLMNQK